MNSQIPPPYMASSYYPSTYPTIVQPMPPQQSRQQYQPQQSKIRVREGTTPLPSNEIGFNKYYIIGNLREGVARLFLIITLLGGFISILAVPNNSSQFEQLGDLSSTRTAYLVVNLLLLIFSIAFFVLNILNFVNFKLLRKGSWFLILSAVFDFLFIILLFSVSVAAAAREGQLPLLGNTIYTIVNRGAFCASAVFGLLGVLLLIYLFICDLVRFSNERFMSYGSTLKSNYMPAKVAPIKY